MGDDFLNQELKKAQDYVNKGALETARDVLHNILQTSPEHPPTLYLLGNICIQEGRQEEARTYLELAVHLDPGSFIFQNTLGVLMFMTHQYEKSEQLFRSALQIAPKNLELICNLGILLRHTGQHNEALDCFRYVRANGQVSPNILEELGEELIRHSELERAFQLFSTLKSRMPGKPHHLAILGMIKAVNGNWEGAESEWQQALSLNPEHAETYALRGTAFLNIGQIDDAIIMIEKALKLDPSLATANFIWAHSAAGNPKATLSSDTVYESIKASLNIEGISFDDWANLKFAAGKIANDCKDYDAAFGHYDEANKAVWARCSVPQSYFESRHAAILDTFTPQYFEKRSDLFKRAPDGDDKAGEGLVFIFGMPRSGTTLAEHILARSGDVHAGGETRDMDDLFEQTFSFSADVGQLKQNAENLDLESARRIAANFHKRIQGSIGANHVYTDKTTRNYMLLGFLACVFPRAKFIHCVRDPVDTCLSCYFNYFQLNSIRYSYNLEMLARVYTLYNNMMENWRRILPVPIHEFIYENVISSPEETIRSYTDHCGFNWHEKFLLPQAGKNKVMTASVAQVRKPLYTSSVQRWKAYEEHLKPLLEGLRQT